MAAMSKERLDKFTTFLANYKDSGIDTTERPSPDIGHLLITKAFLRRISVFVGQGSKEALDKDMLIVATRHPGIMGDVDKIWDYYGSDEAFIGMLKTIMYTSSRKFGK
jgi:hypothetical protein